MLTNVWVKYLPVLRIVLKRSLTSEQQFRLNAPDFERAGYTRKSGYKFSVKLSDGRLKKVLVDMPMASSLVSALLEDPAIREVLQDGEFHISMNAKFELAIKHIPHRQEQPVAEAI